MWKSRRRKGEMLPGLKQGEPRSLPGVLCNQNLQDLTLSHQNQQAEACKEGCKTPIKVMEDSYASIEIFQTTNRV
jgi:hypothetical protein